MIEKRWITTLTYQQSTNHAEDYRLFFFDCLDRNISPTRVFAFRFTWREPEVGNIGQNHDQSEIFSE
ncbi:hypothetical protein GDO81_002991 [Engystomops pustulosus]|uniref:Uncharacterized protein n=1 Tax=Engystomops pustulosus TaxID=76066 RepID=A0AAV7DRQ3_ENGPU|nr:hypothetical protein GDO81_002991 [Engystomops pustulosus]